MKSLRSQLILSHILPLLLLLPLLGLLLAYIVETQVLLADLTQELANHAAVLAQSAEIENEIFRNRDSAQTFLQDASARSGQNVALYQANGEEWVLAQANPNDLAQPTSNEIDALAAGSLQVRSLYNVDPARINAEAFAPVLDTEQRLVGIVRVAASVERVYARFTQMRVLILGSTLAALLVAIVVGAWLAARMAKRLNTVTNAITQVAQGNVAIASNETMPLEFQTTLDAVNALQNRLQESERARKRLLANLVHELGRPLAALQAAIRALRQGADRDETLRQELLQGMDAQVERLKPLLDNLASLHGELSGAVELHRAPVALSEWLRGVTLTWQHAAAEKNLMWQADIPDDLPRVEMDADRMAQVLGNLLSNAIKYTPEGGGIFLSAGTRTNEVWVAVRDTGGGIAAQDLPYIFDPLYRGTSAPFGGTNRFPQGMGLGLSIARDLVNAHGGRIEVASEVGQGSTFTLVLPK